MIAPRGRMERTLMNYSGLQAIISSIKDSVSCPHCQGSYGDDDLAVVSAVDERCVIVAQCPSCHAAILVTAALQKDQDGTQTPDMVKRASILVRKTAEGQVNPDDVVSIHELLKNFSGDIAALVDEG
jgi:hypothetical protein